jgi:hypothetical protein
MTNRPLLDSARRAGAPSLSTATYCESILSLTKRGGRGGCETHPISDDKENFLVLRNSLGHQLLTPPEQCADDAQTQGTAGNSVYPTNAPNTMRLINTVASPSHNLI